MNFDLTFSGFAQAHLLLHIRDETLNCPECGEEFSTLVQLKRHNYDEHHLEEDAPSNDGNKAKDARSGEDRDNPPIDVTVQLVNNLEHNIAGKENVANDSANNGAWYLPCLFSFMKLSLQIPFD